MRRTTDQLGALAATTAAVLGLASAVLSAYWAAGGHALIDTIGGDIERWARERDADAVVSLALIAGLKAAVAIAAPILAGAGSNRLPPWTSGRVPRALGWVAAAVLTVYGGVLTVVGVLVDIGIVDAAADADSEALAWHAYVWDPWFALWGIAFCVALWRSRA